MIYILGAPGYLCQSCDDPKVVVQPQNPFKDSASKHYTRYSFAARVPEMGSRWTLWAVYALCWKSNKEHSEGCCRGWRRRSFCAKFCRRSFRKIQDCRQSGLTLRYSSLAFVKGLIHVWRLHSVRVLEEYRLGAFPPAVR